MTSSVVTEIDMEEGQLAISEMILVIMLNHISLKTYKTYFLNYCYQTLKQQQQVQSITHQTKQILWRIFNENLSKVDTNNVEIYILGEFNINLWRNGHYVFQKHNFPSCLSVLNDVKNYFMFGLKQLVESPTRITCSSSSSIDHILASFPDRVI